ncbi:MAG: endonuclease domain-containing protein [Ignavibacteriaceae bacterium]
MSKHYNKTEEKEKRRQLRKVQTFCEKIMWLHLKNRQLLGIKFRRQYSIDQFVIDFYAPKIKFAIELDGNIHELQEQKDYDIQRQKYLENYGITFIRIKNEELIGNANKAFKKIEKLIVQLKE